MPKPASKVDWRRSSDGTRSSRGRLTRRIVLSLILATLAGVLIWLLIPPNYPEARFVSLSVTEYDIELPPIAVFPKDIDRFEQSSYLGKFDRLDPLQTSEAIGRLGGRLRGIVSADDTLILYVAAHGVSENGVPQLLCSDFLRIAGNDSDSPNDSGRFELSEFLAHVVDCPANLKLVILDVGHIASDPRLGMVINEFPRLLVEQVKKIDDPTLWVLSANRSLETTHVSHAMRRSIFSHFCSLGLRGDADKTGNNDGRIDLAELSHFVRMNVAHWVSHQTDRAVTQTPLLLKAGVGIVDDFSKPPFLQLASRDNQEENVDATVKEPSSEANENIQEGSNNLDATHQTHAVRLVSHVEPSSETKRIESTPKTEITQPSDVVKDNDTSLPAEGRPNVEPNIEPNNTPQVAKTAKPPETAKSTEKAKSTGKAKPGSKDTRLRQLLLDAWTIRDRMQVRRMSEPWSPIDYAPHLWREYQAILLGYELRYRRGTVLDEQKLDALEDLTRGENLASHVGRNTILGQLANARSAFLDRDAHRGFDQKLPGVKTIAEAVKLHNDLLFDMPDYLRWHAEHSRLASGDRSLGQTLISLLDELADLIDLLESLSPSRSTSVSTGVNPRRILADLTERTERLQALRDEVDLGHLEAEVYDLLDDPTRPGSVARIEAVLSTPLLPGPSRTRLLEALGHSAQDTPDPPDVSLPNRAANDSLIARKSIWDAVREQAHLEAKLVLLADPEYTFSLSVEKFTRPRNHDDEEKLWGEYRLFGAELGVFYRGLPARIHDSNEHRPHRLIRLLDARDVRRTLGRTLTAACFPSIDWARLKMIRPGLEAPSNITLVRDDWVSLEVRLEVTGGQAKEVSYRLDYNPAQLQIEDVDRRIQATRSRWCPTALGATGVQTLYLRVRCEAEPRDFDPILVHLRVDGEETTRQITPHLPSPNVVDLVIERITGSVATSAQKGDRFATVLVDQPKDDGVVSVVRCRAFSNRNTEYRMALANRSGRARKVVVDLLTVQSRLAFDPSSRPDPFNRFGQLATGFTRVAGPLEVELPADDTLTPIPFPDPKTEEKGMTKTEGEPTETPKPDTEDVHPGASHSGPLVTHGILCLIRDEQRRGQWSRWIDFSPVAPREFLQADVRYSHARRRVSIKLAPLASSRVLPPLSKEEPINVVWETAGVLPPGSRMKTATRLSNASHSADLDAVIDPDVTQSVEIRLSVNGYPRAFVFHPFQTNRDKLQAEINGDLRRVEIVSPASGNAFRVPLESPLLAKVHIDAPTDAFRKPGDVLEVGIDQNNDRTLGDDEKQSFFADRHVEMRLGRIGPGGVIEVFTLVRDFEIKLDPAGLANTRVDIKADLLLNDRLEASANVPIVLDGARPVFDRLIVPTRPVPQGAEVEVRARIRDTSGVKVVRFGFDRNHSNTLDDDEKLEELFHPNDGPDWRALIPTENLKPRRTYTLIVLATDRVDLTAKQTRPVAISEPVVVTDTPEPVQPKTSVIHGRIYMNNPDERLRWTAPDVWLEENGRHAKPDNRGTFTFDDLPLGDYTLIASGMAGNKILEGKKKVNVTEKEAQVLIRMGKPE